MSKLLHIKTVMLFIFLGFLYLVAWFALQGYSVHLQYMIGYSEDTHQYISKAFRFGVFSGIANFLVFLSLFVTAGIILYCKYRVKRVIPSLFFALIFLFFSPYVVSKFYDNGQPYIHMTNGYYDRIVNCAKIDEIRDWIGSDKRTLPSQIYGLPRNEWPEAIKELYPSEVCFSEIASQRIVSLVYGSSWTGGFGLTVMENPVTVPYNHIYEHEYRVQIKPYAYVWHERKSKSSGDIYRD